MKSFVLSISAIVLLATGGSVWAARVVECRDADGNVYFADRCPEQTKQVKEQTIYVKGGGGVDLQRISAEAPIVIYSTPSCDACDLMRNHLRRWGLPFSEKGVADDADNQKELKDKTGVLQVPVITVGETVVNGYNPATLSSALDTAGYPQEKTEEGEADGS